MKGTSWMKALSVFLVCLFLLQFSANAADPDNVVLNPGDKVPYQGILMPLPRAQRVDVLQLNYNECNTLSGLKDQEAVVMTQRLNNATQENAALAKELNDERSSTFLSKLGYFALGVGITGLISYGVVKTLR